MLEYNNNLDMTLSNNYRVAIGDNKELDFYVVDFSVPDLNIGVEEVVHYGGKNGKNLGTKYIYDNKLEYGDVTIKFLLDEKLYTYLYFVDLMFNIIKSNGKNNLDEHKNIALFITTNKKNPMLKLLFGKCKFSGVSIGSYNNTDGSQYKTVDVSFKIETFEHSLI
jgi:hypothetical protein